MLRVTTGRVGSGRVIVNFPRAGSGRVSKFENSTGRVGSRVGVGPSQARLGSARLASIRGKSS